MNAKEVGRRLSMNGGQIGEHTEIKVAKAIRMVGTADTDKDGVPDMYDCQPLNPEKDGFFGDIGRAAKERATAEIEDIKERAVERVRGRPVAARVALKDIEREEEWEEEKRIRKERGKKRAQIKYGVAPGKTKKKSALSVVSEGEAAPTKKRKKKVQVKKLPARTEYYVGL